ncbi:hypothetical protein D3C85_1566250 [compost metagenome]
MNTAPGLAGETLQGYLKRLTGYINGEVALPNRDVPKAFVGDEVIVPKAARPIPDVFAVHNGHEVALDKAAFRPIDMEKLRQEWAGIVDGPQA